MLYCTWNGKKGPFRCQVWSDLLSDGCLKDGTPVLRSTWNCYFRTMNKCIVQCCGSWFICVCGSRIQEGQKRPAIWGGAGGKILSFWQVCGPARVCCCEILSPLIEVLCYWDHNGRECQQIINSLSQVPCFWAGTGGKILFFWQFAAARFRVPCLKCSAIGTGEGVPVELIYILKDYTFCRLERVCHCKIINSLSEVPCCWGRSGRECQ